MPHTNRKKKSSDDSRPKNPRMVQTKRELLDDDEGWTHVVDAKKTLKKPETKELGLKPWEGDFVSGKTAIVTMDLKEMEAEHTRFKQQWEDSEACTKLKALLVKKRDDIKISSVICLGLGSLQNWTFHARRASHTQLAALQTIIGALGIESAKKIAQEPSATELDKRFLSSIGFESYEDPEAVKCIDGESLVFAVHCYTDLYQQIGQQVQAAVLIATDLERHVEKLRALKEDDQTKIENLEKLTIERDVIDFPQIRHDFSGAQIYAKASAEITESQAEKPVDVPTVA